MTEIIFDKDENWEHRTLCKDESCIGTIGSDGKCKECGKAYEEEIPSLQVTHTGQGMITDEPKPVSLANTDSDNDWDKRVLCSDESCIGTIGAHGKCKECGKPL